MKDGVRRLTRQSGVETIVCLDCQAEHGEGNGRHLARLDPHGLWLFCKSCRAPRLMSWSLVASTLVSYCDVAPLLAPSHPAAPMSLCRGEE